MTIQRGLGVTIGSGLVFGCLGALMGWALGTFAPDYYRLTLGISTDVHMDMSQVAIGLGVTQGLALGIVVGLVIVLSVAWYDSRIVNQTAALNMVAAAEAAADTDRDPSTGHTDDA